MFQMSPQTKLKSTFYLVFTLYGLFHAEVLSRSQPWVLLNPLWFALVAPVYGVHYIVLGDLLLRRRATGFWPVFIAGCILGMYEFVITKVFWNPTWTPFAPRFMEVAVLETFYVGFWWHAFMSFGIPFFLVRKLLLEGETNPLRIKHVRYILIGVPIIAVSFGTTFGSSIFELMATTLLSIGVLIVGSLYFLRKAPKWGFRGPGDIVLGPVGRRRGLLLLIMVYAFYGATMRPEAWPAPVGLVIPASLYAALFLMFYPFVRAKPKGVQVAAAGPEGAMGLSPAQHAALAAPSAPPFTVPMVAGSLTPEQLAALSPPPAAAASSAVGLKRFFAPYAAGFASLAIAFQVLALVAPWVLLVISIGIILTAGFSAFALLALSARKSWSAWTAGKPQAG